MASERNMRARYPVNIYLYAHIVPLSGSTCRSRCIILFLLNFHDNEWWGWCCRQQQTSVEIGRLAWRFTADPCTQKRRWPRCGAVERGTASSGILDILLSSSPFVVPSAPSLAPTLSDNSIHTPFTRSLIRSRGIGPAWHINSNRLIRKDLPEFMCLRSLFFFLLSSSFSFNRTCVVRARAHLS